MHCTRFGRQMRRDWDVLVSSLFKIECACSKIVRGFKDIDILLNGHTQLTITPYGYLHEPDDADMVDKACYIAIKTMNETS